MQTVTSTQNHRSHDHTILRKLLEEYAQAASERVSAEKSELWRRLNSLDAARPMVWINEVPWHEMNVNDELTLRCESPYCRSFEEELRRTLYQWRHFPADMVLDAELYVPIVCGPTSSYADYGMKSVCDRSDMAGGSVGIKSSIRTKADVDRMQAPKVWVDWEETERRYQTLSEVADGILKVYKRGIVHQWYSPWDQITFWYGIEKLYDDVIEQPELVHYVMEKFTEIAHQVLDQQISLGLLAVSNGNHRVGSGGLGITNELPHVHEGAGPVQPSHQWGTAAAQVFSEISPSMHEEFALQYERPYVERFGLSCYGCCEPLHRKIGLLRSIKNLRRISMSPFVDLNMGAQAIGSDYVLSHKASPTFLGMPHFDATAVRRSLVQALEITRGCHVEIILKDISTVNRDPRKLWEWADIAMDVVENAA